MAIFSPNISKIKSNSVCVYSTFTVQCKHYVFKMIVRASECVFGCVCTSISLRAITVDLETFSSNNVLYVRSSQNWCRAQIKQLNVFFSLRTYFRCFFLSLPHHHKLLYYVPEWRRCKRTKHSQIFTPLGAHTKRFLAEHSQHMITFRVSVNRTHTHELP